MQYNENFFGVKQDVYNNANNDMYMYSVGTKNTNAQAALISQDATINSYLPDDIFYWMIGKDSPYGRYTLQKRTGSGGAYTWDTDVTGATDKDIPIVLTCRGNKHNSTTINIDVAGSGNYGNNYDAIPNRYFIPSSFAVTGSPSYPIWFETDTLSTSVQTHQTGSDFIVDFDYNNIIAVIQVNGSSNGGTRDLANYNNTPDNFIYSFGYSILAGVIDSNNNARIRTSSQTRYIGNTNIGTTSANAAKIVTDYHFKTASVMEYYSKPEFALLKTLDNNTHGEMIFDGSLIGTSTSYAVNYYMDNEHWELSADGTRYQLKKHGNNIYNDDDFNYIRRCIAYIGFWFTDGGIYTDNEHSYTINRQDCLLGDNANTYSDSYMIPDKVYQSEIKDGITTGNYTELRIAKDNEQSKWGKEWRDKNGYNGRDTGKEEKDFGNLNTVLHRGNITAGCKWYGLNSTQLNGLITWMNSGYQPASNDQFINDFKGVNPAEYITSITYLPFYPIPSGTDELINIGPLSTAVTGRKIAYEYGVTVDLGSYTLDRYFDDFRDYKPYTAISLYIPFCGTVELDAANYYNRTINVKLMIDMSTGSCTGLVFANDLLIDTISGQCGVKIPLAAFNMGDYQDAIINAQYQLKQAERQRDNAMIGAGIAIVGGAITAGTGIGAVAGAAAAIYAVNKMYDARDKIENIEYNIEHMQPKQTNISTGSPTNSLGMEYDARLIITRPTTLDTDINIYGHTVGYMTNKQGVLSDFSGFTQCSNADLSGIPMTSSELASIHEALKSGVYLP
jgi:hypothetical protein